MPTDLRERRLLSGVGPLQRSFRVDTARVAADAHHQHAAGTQVQGRADRCRLAHRAVTEIFLADFYRGEQQWDGGAGEQVLDGQLRRNADASMA
ncbi:hypothetical protein D3C84_840820 [compost metagenome]